MTYFAGEAGTEDPPVLHVRYRACRARAALLSLLRRGFTEEPPPARRGSSAP
jgi:hypothetical protein